MKNYREQDGCWNCKQSFVDTWANLICLKLERPKIEDSREYMEFLNKNPIRHWGICDEWEGD